MCFFPPASAAGAGGSFSFLSAFFGGMDDLFKLADDQADLWLLSLTAPREADRHVLDSDEQARLARFVFQASRDEFLAAHTLLRRILAGYEQVAPQALVFARNAYGRPELSGGQGGLRFSLSHSGAFGALAVTRAGAVGVDVEPSTRQLQAVSRIENYFAPAEAAWLRRQPAARQSQDFLALWTLKEAYLKARGFGLSLALDSFAMDLTDRARPTIRFQDSAEQPAGWQLFHWETAQGALLSLAVQRPASQPLRVKLVEAEQALRAPVGLA
jgi:4'-phosphopantetheinyl transferase